MHTHTHTHLTHASTRTHTHTHTPTHALTHTHTWYTLAHTLAHTHLAHARTRARAYAQRSHGVTSDSDFLAHLDADAARVRAAVAGGYNGAVAEFGEEHVLVGVFVAIVAGVLSSVCCVVVCLTGRVPVPFLSRKRMRGARRGRAR